MFGRGGECVQVCLIDGLTLGTLICAEAEASDSGTGSSSMSMAVHCKIGERVSL